MRVASQPCEIGHSDVTQIIAVQVADALLRLHSSGVVHTDTKPDDVLVRVCDRSAIIIDFSIAEVVMADEWRPRSLVCSAYPYRAPEFWRASR